MLSIAKNYTKSDIHPLIAQIEELKSSGDILDDSNDLYLLDVVLGAKYFSTGGSAFSIANGDAVDPIFVVFYEAGRGSVLVGDTLPEEPVSCLTVAWLVASSSQIKIDAGLAFADSLLRNLELASGLPCPVHLSVERLGETFAMRRVNLIDGSYGEVQVRGNAHKWPLLSEDVRDVLAALAGHDPAFAKAMSGELHAPFSLAARWQQKAIRAGASNDFEGCIVFSAVWVETFVVGLGRLLNDLGGGAKLNVRNAVRGGIPAFIADYIGARHLGGAWGVADTSTEFGRWHVNCHRVRNATVHEGALATKAVAKGAYEAAHDFVKHLSRRVAGLSDPAFAELTELFRGTVAGFERK